MTQYFIRGATIALLSAALSGRADATEELAPAREAPGWSADVEIDPLAYAVRGHSVHVGLGHGRVRVDLGAFAADVPEWMHGNEGFDVRADGFGAKLDVFLKDDWRGPFAGLEAAVTDTTLRSPGGEHDRETRLQVGGRAGWRILLPAGFYATPWVGLGYAIGAGDRRVGAFEYEASPWVLFPTLHLGYRID